MTPQEIYKALLRPECTATLVERSRKKLINNQLPTKALMKKAEACAKKEKSEPSPKQKSKSKTVSPKQKKRYDSPMSYEKPQKNSKGVVNEVYRRIERGEKLRN